MGIFNILFGKKISREVIKGNPELGIPDTVRPGIHTSDDQARDTLRFLFGIRKEVPIRSLTKQESAAIQAGETTSEEIMAQHSEIAGNNFLTRLRYLLK